MMSVDAGLHLVTSTGTGFKHDEQIEWDIPYEREGGNFPDLSNLSLGTEMRNKMWESDNKLMIGGHMVSQLHHSQNSPLSHLDHNQNPSSLESNTAHFMNGLNLNLSSKPVLQGIGVSSGHVPLSGKFIEGNSQSLTGTGIASPILKQSRKSQPSLPLLNEQKNHDIHPQENGMNENQLIKEELLEMKSIFTKLASKTDDISGLPEPVQLVLKIIELETKLEEYDNKFKNQEIKTTNLNFQLEKTKKDWEFEIETLKKENQFLKEKIEYKINLEASTKGRMKGKEEQNDDNQEIEELREEFKTLQEDFTKKTQEAEMNEQAQQHKIELMKLEVSHFENEIAALKERLEKNLGSEQQRRNEIERYVSTGRESVERERQDHYILLVEQNKLKHKVDKLSESCKSYQMKNEELCRIQNELEQECDQFRKLKKIIQDHGLPNHEQLVILQQQTEMFKDDVLSERKDRERAQAQRDKLRRDLEILQSRNQSLQEQVYKYQEHIMRLNTGDRRVQQQDFIPQQQQQQPPPPQQQPQQQQQGGNGRFSRQLSNPAYFNPRMRMGPPNVVNPLMKSAPMMVQTGNRHHFGDVPRNVQGFHNGGGNMNNNNFEWKQQQQLQPLSPPVVQQRNMFSPTSPVGNRMPQSPLLGPNGDPWIMAPSSPNNQTTQQQSSGGNYHQNIWSQPSPSSPSFNSRNSQSPSNWQSDSPTFSPTSNGNQSENGTNGGTAVDGWLNSFAENQQQPQLKSHNYSKDSDGFQCRKCNAKLTDTESFREHAEVCFN